MIVENRKRSRCLLRSPRTLALQEKLSIVTAFCAVKISDRISCHRAVHHDARKGGLGGRRTCSRSLAGDVGIDGPAGHEIRQRWPPPRDHDGESIVFGEEGR